MAWSGKGNGGQKPPDLEAILNTIKGKFGGKFPGLWVVIVVVLVVWALSAAYTIGVNEVGIIQRLGKYTRTTEPGLHFKLPWGIEKLTKVKVKHVYKEEFGLRTLQAGVRTQYARAEAYLNESLMLTGDLNVAVVPWIVQYRIKDPYNYLFKVKDVTTTLRDLSEASMRLVVGDRSINEVISKREEIADQSKLLLQKELDGAETGIYISTIEMKKTNVPEPVQPSFNEVNQAVQEKERMVYQAREEYNKAIPAAKGNAEKTIKAAEGYALDRINRAKGDASRFVSVYSEYSKAKDVTKRRLYLETFKDVLPKLGNKYIIDEDQKNILPFLNLEREKGDKK